MSVKVRKLQPDELFEPASGTSRRNGHSPNASSRRNGHSPNGSLTYVERLDTDLQPYLAPVGPDPGDPEILTADARKLPIPDSSVDLVVTSPPYWRKRDYKLADQIGREASPDEYVKAMMVALTEWRRVLRPTGSVFLNIGDSYWKRSVAGIPGLLEAKAREAGWILRNRIIWAKDRGMPEPAKDRLANRHEYILHLVKRPDYYYDLFGYYQVYGNGIANPGDVWWFEKRPRHMGAHLAPFPDELVERAILLACPREVCSKCGEPRRRDVRRTAKLDPRRPQAVRAMQLALEKQLTPAHIEAIQATGVSDVGKALRTQTGTGKNSKEVQELAAVAKEALGGYFREFTFPKWEDFGFKSCTCGEPFVAGAVLDPFMGTGTTLRVSLRMGRRAIGADLEPPASILR